MGKTRIKAAPAPPAPAAVCSTETPATTRKRKAVNTPPSAETAAPTLNEYEQAREKRVKENEARLQALQLPALARVLAPPPKPARARGLVKKKARAAEAAPPRKSLRLAGGAVEGALAGGILEERRDGSVLLASGGLYLPAVDAPKTRPSGVLPFASTNGDAASDAVFLQTLRDATVVTSFVPSCTSAELAKAGVSLPEHNVAKACVKGITHLDFLPRSDALLLALGDKEGNISLFSPTESSIDEAESESNDGVWLARPHSQYISGLKWARSGAPKLFTCSYDGSLRCLDATQGEWREALVSEDEFSCFDCTPDGTLLLIGDNEGGVRTLDSRGGGATPAMAAHSKRVNTVQLEQGGSLVATACGDASVCVWDLRKGLGGKCKPLASLSHGKSCQSAYWAPSGPTRLLTTSYDDTLTVWSDKYESATRIKHDNNTGRWLLPFRAIWAADGAAVVCGNMSRETELFDPKTGGSMARWRHEALLTAVPSRHACHAGGAAVAAATASGRVHVWMKR
jgi:WD40 repeat protein